MSKPGRPKLAKNERGTYQYTFWKFFRSSPNVKKSK